MSRWVEERIAAFASRQHGVVSRPQLLASDVTSRMVDRCLLSGRLRRLHQGVYLAESAPQPRGRVMAAILASGTSARASHRTAAWLRGLGPQPVGSWPIEVKVPSGRVVRRRGIRAYRSRGLESVEPTVIDGIPVTDVAETLVDLAGVLPSRGLERAVARAERENLVALPELVALVARIGRGPGLATLASLLTGEAGPSLTRSELEALFLEEIAACGLDPPRLNFRRGGFELDAYWHDARLAAELDGQAYHRSWRSQENDRTRDSMLAAEGIQVIRITWRQLVHETRPTMVRLAQALAVRRDRLRDERRH
jgi:hypothetical protein